MAGAAAFLCLQGLSIQETAPPERDCRLSLHRAAAGLFRKKEGLPGSPFHDVENSSGRKMENMFSEIPSLEASIRPPCPAAIVRAIGRPSP